VYTGDRGLLRPLFDLAEDSPTQLDAYLADGTVLVAECDGEVVGHLQLVTAKPGVLEIKNMAVRPSHQRRGAGAALVAAALDAARGERATVVQVATAAAARGCEAASLQSTGMAEGVYRAVGFRDLGRILEYAPRG